MVNDLSLGLCRFWLANYSNLTVPQVAIRVLQIETRDDELSSTSGQGFNVCNMRLLMAY